MNVILEAKQLVKKYNSFTAVDGIDLAIETGSCFGLLGPNGAGKTTTVEMLEGIIAPTSGEILFRGRPLADDFRHRAGIQFQHTSLQEFLTVRETLELFKELYPSTTSLDEIIEQCALKDILDRDNQRLSGGQRQRLLLALAIINDPDIIFLDEPTTGLDPQSRRNFWELISNIKAKGKTVLLTTHYMEEAAVLCDRIAIMDKGKIIAEGTPQALIKNNFDEQIVILPANGETQNKLGGLNISFRSNGDNIEIPTNELNDLMHSMLSHDIPMHNCTIRQYNLEDLFIKLTGHSLRE